MVSVCKRLFFFIINVGAIESSDIEGKIEKPCQVQYLKKNSSHVNPRDKGSVAISFAIKTFNSNMQASRYFHAFAEMLIHLFFTLQKSIKRPCYSNNINIFLHSCKETY